jgi:DNA-directed RNA polymerase subunit RPC12/RpoP
MVQCGNCGGRLKRIHRTFSERFSYMAIYECRKCSQELCIPRRYRYHLGGEARCPHCGTTRLTKLKDRDGIDPMQSGLLNLMERLAGGKLYHCCFCRIQFYDRRHLEPRVSGEAQAEESASAAAAAEGAVTTPPDTAKSDE